MSIFAGQDCSVPTRAELEALDALLDLGESQVNGVVAVAAELVAVVVVELRKDLEADAAEVFDPRRRGVVSAPVRRANTRTTRRTRHAALRRLTGAVDGGVGKSSTGFVLVAGTGSAA